MLDGLPHAAGLRQPRSDSTNTRPVMALALFARCRSPRSKKKLGKRTRHFVKFGLTGLGRPPRPALLPHGAIAPDRHPLILDGLAVTFYLVFKEPEPLRPSPLASRPSRDEPFKLTELAPTVSRLFLAWPMVARPAPAVRRGIAPGGQKPRNRAVRRRSS